MKLLIPSDLLKFDDQYLDVISKSFGGFVLTNCDEDSKELIEKYKISSV